MPNLIKDGLASRYEKLPKVVKEKVSYTYFIRFPKRIELAVETTKNIIVGKTEIAIKMQKGERICVWKFTKE
tara:strand:- start:255 stop:470 length:216 start_codon:yes stop_codon:yes gene_type:complete